MKYLFIRLLFHWSIILGNTDLSSTVNFIDSLSFYCNFFHICNSLRECVHEHMTFLLISIQYYFLSKKKKNIGEVLLENHSKAEIPVLLCGFMEL